MNISCVQNNTSFKGYDVMPLRGLYMQGWENFHGQKITQEMAEIAKKENIPLYVNNYGKIIRDAVQSLPCLYDSFCVWAQDTKNFLCNGGIKNLLCSSREAILKKDNLGELSDYEVRFRKNLPRGGNFYIGYKPDGEKWMILSAKTTMKDIRSIYKGDYDENTRLRGLHNTRELVTLGQIADVFGVKIENICLVNTSYEDLDMLVRPIGYPYVLVNDCDSTVKNMMKLKSKNADNNKQFDIFEMYDKCYKYDYVSKELADLLEKAGFIPVKIGGAYSNDVNFLNALAFRTENGGISYITNSTRDSSPEFEYLEKLFEEDLRSKVDNIENVYFVSGGNARENGFPDADKPDINSMMYWLGGNRGGIHCMTAEIPDFDKIV